MKLFLLFVLVTLLFLIATIFKLYRFQTLAVQRNRSLSKLLGVHSRHRNEHGERSAIGRNCIDEDHFCTDNSDCFDICATDSVPFECNKVTLTCEPFSFEEYSVDAVRPVNCNQSHGFLKVLSVNRISGGYEWQCISTLSKFFDKDDNMHSYACNSGQFLVNAFEKLPQLSDCECGPETSRTRVKRAGNSVPRCVPTNLLKLLPSFEQY